MTQFIDVWKFSQNRIYAVNSEYEDIIFIRTDAQATDIHPFLIEIKDIDDDLKPPARRTGAGDAAQYSAYTFFKRFGSRAENDCLLFAEGMSINKFPYTYEDCQFREKITHRIFGDSDEENIDIAGEVRHFRECFERRNTSINPEIGECYVIMLCDYIPDGYIPYHVAYVIFKDGATNITIEANAGGRNKKPLFDIYSTDPARGTTFHETYRDVFLIQEKNPQRVIEPITTILEPIEKNHQK